MPVSSRSFYVWLWGSFKKLDRLILKLLAALHQYINKKNSNETLELCYFGGFLRKLFGQIENKHKVM